MGIWENEIGDMIKWNWRCDEMEFVLWTNEIGDMMKWNLRYEQMKLVTWTNEKSHACRRAASGHPFLSPHTTRRDTVSVFYPPPTGERDYWDYRPYTGFIRSGKLRIWGSRSLDKLRFWYKSGKRVSESGKSQDFRIVCNMEIDFRHK